MQGNTASESGGTISTFVAGALFTNSTFANNVAP